MTMSDFDLQLESVRDAMVETPKEPLPQWLNSVLSRTDELIATLNKSDLRYLSKDQMLVAFGLDANDIFTMSQIAARLQVIASSIWDRDPPAFKIVRGGSRSAERRT